MKLIVFIIMVCGQPDFIAIKEQGQPVIGGDVRVIRQDPHKMRDLKRYMSREDKEVIVLEYNNGICT